MQEQVFSFVVIHDAKIEVNTDVIRDKIKDALSGRVDRYIGMVTEGFGGTSAEQRITCRLRFIHRDNISVKDMKSYLADMPDTFKLAEITKR